MKRQTKKNKMKENKKYPYKQGGKDRCKKILGLLLVLMFGIVFLVGTISAEELLTFDNIKLYDDVTQTVTIVNTFGIGRDIVDIKLNTPINNVVRAGYGKVAEFDINLYDDIYTGAFDKMEFYDLGKDWEKIDRQFDYKYKTIEEIEIIEKNGTRIEYKEVWKDLSLETLTKGNITIGIFTDVQMGDYVEWIPTLFGKEIDEWATFIQAETTGVALTSTSAVIGKAGQIVEVNQTINISAIKVATGSESTYVYVQSQYATGFLGNASVVGGVANFTPQIELTTGNHYYLLAGAEGVSHAIYYATTSGFPFDTGYLNWFMGVTEAGANATSYVREIDVVWLDTGISTENIAIDLLSPINNANLTDSTPTLSSNVTNSSVFIENVTVNVYNASGNIFTETNTSGIPFIYNFTTSTLIDGSYKWNVTAYGNSSIAYSSSTYNFTIDTIIPQINISAPTTNQNFKYLVYGNNITLNVTITDVRLQTCWYDYNSTNTTFSCSTGVLSENNLTITNQTSIMVWANDSSGEINSSSVSWTFDLFDFDEYSYTTPALEVSINAFSNKFQTKDSLSSSYLEYNNTNYSTSIVSQGEKIYLLSYSPTAPTVGADTNISWNFWVNNINATEKNQTVTNLLGDDCTTYSTPILNFTLYDEENINTRLSNTTITYSLTFSNTIGTNTIFKVNGTTGTNPLAICLNSSIYGINLSLTGTMKFFANTSTTDYIIRYYNFLNNTLTNETSPRNISLYSLNSTKPLPFLLTFRDSDSALAPNILVKVQRQYLKINDFLTIEIPITDTSGQTILNLIRNTEVYNLIMINSYGEIVAAFNNIVAFCQDYTIGSCSIDLSASGEGDITYDYDTDVGISYVLSYSNSSKLVSLNFNSLTDSNKKVDLVVISQNQFENQSICTDTLTASSGTLSCDVSSALGTNQILFSRISVDDNLIATETLYTNPSLPSKGGVFGKSGFFLAFLFILFLILLVADDKQVLVISLGIGWVVIISLGLVKGALIGGASGGIWLIITIFIFLWKLKEEAKL